MAKVRIHDLAKELKMENKDLLKLLEKMGLAPKSVHSTLDESDVERVKNQINLSRKEGVVEQRVKPTVIRRRVVRDEAAVPAPPFPEKEEAQAPEVKPPQAKPSEIRAPEVKPPVAQKPPPYAPEGAPKFVAPAEKEKTPETMPPSSPEMKPLQPAVPQTPVGPPPVETKISGEIKTPPVVAKEPVIPSIVTREVQPPPLPQASEPAAPEKPVSREAVRPAVGEKPALEKPKPPEKPPQKLKKKHEPAKIIERPAVPPPSLVQGHARSERAPAPGGPSRPPTPHPRPPIILQRPAPGVARPASGAARPASEEAERGARRGKKFKKDVQVLEEGKPHRVRIISTKKRTFKDPEYYHSDDREATTIVSGEETRFKGARPKGKKPEPTIPKAIKRKIRIAEAILVGELAKRMGIKAAELIKKLMELGLMVTINQAIDADAAALVAADFGYEIEKTGLEIEDLIEEKEEKPEDLVPRPPVVTIMGHVDHGKTSLLDAIRQTNVTAGEAGGITQHIGAYEVDVDSRKIVFLDTPGHEAFTAMRARGAKVTDIVILVVAADDGVMTQTIEAINHAKAADVPIIVAINKIDKPNANPERVKQGLTEYGLVPEAWGGQTIFAEISAKQKTGLKELLENILIQADILELKATPSRPMSGIIIESKLDKGRGPVATVLVQDGTLQIGDAFVAGIYFGHVRAMISDRGQKLESSGPSTPVEVIGFSSVPNAGDTFVVVTDEKRGKDLANQRLLKQREAELAKSSKISLEDFYKRMQKGDVKDLNLILKGDVQGSVEALTEALQRLSTDTIHPNILHSSVGAVNESDCMLASASDAIIIGFNIRVEPQAQTLAEHEKIDIRLYNIIYEVIDDVRKAMEGLLEPIYTEKLMGRAQVRQVFRVSRVGVIAGSFVLEGKIIRGSKARLLRDGKVIYEGSIPSIKRVKDDVKDVASGYECGISLADFQDIMTNDIIESFTVEKTTASLQ